MDLDQAVTAHTQWKLKLRTAISRKEQLDVAVVCRDDQCPLGKWLHGEGRLQYGARGTFTRLTDSHRKFHAEVGNVAREVNGGRFAQAEKLLEAGSAFAGASTDVGMAINALKRELQSA